MTFASLGKAVLEKMRLPPHIPVQFVDHRDGVNKISNRLDVGRELDLPLAKRRRQSLAAPAE